MEYEALFHYVDFGCECGSCCRRRLSALSRKAGLGRMDVLQILAAGTHLKLQPINSRESSRSSPTAILVLIPCDALRCPALPLFPPVSTQPLFSSSRPSTFNLQPSNNSISIHLLEQCNLSDKVVKPIETFRPGHHHKLFLGCRASKL